MGLTNSRLMGEYYDGLASNSPLKTDDYAHHRVLDIDPRSPSSEITRTPIQVDKTPGPGLVDPRSPSCGISRTPLSYRENEPEIIAPTDEGSYLHADQNDSTLSNEIADISGFESPQLNSSTSSPSLLSSDDLDLPEEADSDDDELQRSISDPELTADQLCLLGSGESDSFLDFNMKTFRQSLHKKCSRAKQLVSKISPTKKSTSTPSGIDQLSQQRRSLGDITAARSPLSTKKIDVNSPRAIVQRKQTHKLSVFRRHSTPDGKSNIAKKYNMISLDDKENFQL